MPHYIQQLWVRWPTRWPLQPLQPFQKTQLQPPLGPSVDSLCHPWFTTTNLSYRFPIFETSATALCGTTGIIHNTLYIYIYVLRGYWCTYIVAAKTLQTLHTRTLSCCCQVANFLMKILGHVLQHHALVLKNCTIAINIMWYLARRDRKVIPRVIPWLPIKLWSRTASKPQYASKRCGRKWHCFGLLSILETCQQEGQGEG